MNWAYIISYQVFEYKKSMLIVCVHCPYMKNRFWSLIFLDFLRPHTTFATYIEAPSRCKWLKDVEGACGRENLSRWILVLWAEAHIHPMYTYVNIWLFAFGLQAGYECRISLAQAMYMVCKNGACPVCTAIAWHLFLRQPNTSDVICLCLCLAGKQETWPSHYVYLNTRVNC